MHRRSPRTRTRRLRHMAARDHSRRALCAFIHGHLDLGRPVLGRFEGQLHLQRRTLHSRTRRRYSRGHGPAVHAQRQPLSLGNDPGKSQCQSCQLSTHQVGRTRTQSFHPSTQVSQLLQRTATERAARSTSPTSPYRFQPDSSTWRFRRRHSHLHQEGQSSRLRRVQGRQRHARTSSGQVIPTVPRGSTRPRRSCRTFQAFPSRIPLLPGARRRSLTLQASLLPEAQVRGAQEDSVLRGQDQRPRERGQAGASPSSRASTRGQRRRVLVARVQRVSRLRVHHSNYLSSPRTSTQRCGRTFDTLNHGDRASHTRGEPVPNRLLATPRRACRRRAQSYHWPSSSTSWCSSTITHASSKSTS